MMQFYIDTKYKHTDLLTRSGLYNLYIFWFGMLNSHTCLIRDEALNCFLG